MPVKTTCPYCGVGCGVVADRDAAGTVTVRGDPQHPANFGRLCAKGSALAETIGLEGRLLEPVVNGQPATWDAALDVVAEGFSRIIREHGPDSVAFYVSGQILTEDYYVVNKLAKGFVGTANIDTNSRLCMASSVAGHKRAFGSDTVPGCYEDLETADLLVLVGSNAAWCHPILYQRMVAAKANNPACRIVVIDPRRTATCEDADLHLPLRSGSDSVLFNGLLAHLARSGAVDRAFVRDFTTGAEAALQQVAGQTVAETAAICGLERRHRRTVLRLVCQDRAGRHALFAGHQSVEQRRRQGQRDHQLPPADRPDRPARHGSVLAHRTAQRHGRTRSRRARQPACRPYGARQPAASRTACSGSGVLLSWRTKPD